MSTMNDNWYQPTFDLAAFRSVVAKYVKLLIRARWKHQSGFLSAEDLARWGLKDIANDNRTPRDLVTEAATTLAALNNQFIPRCGSGGIPCMEHDSAVERLIDAVAFLVPPDGGGPNHNRQLIVLAESLGRGEAFDWTEVVNWNSLAAIRDDLDQLPHARNSSTTDRPKQSVMARFPSLPELRWEEVTIVFVSDDSVRVSARDVRETYLFSEMGFKDRRKGDRPDSRWAFLRELAAHEGRIDWQTKSLSSEQRNRAEKAISTVRKRLKTLMGIEEDPFHLYRSRKAYETRFTLRSKHGHAEQPHAEQPHADD